MNSRFLPLGAFAAAIALLLPSTFVRAELIQKKSLSLDDARKVVAAAVTEAKKGAGTAAIAVVSWPSVARLVRSEVLAQRDRDTDRQLAHAAAAASEPAFAKVWDNPEDDVYDRV
jgi:hypothetical protein